MNFIFAFLSITFLYKLPHNQLPPITFIVLPLLLSNSPEHPPFLPFILLTHYHTFMVAFITMTHMAARIEVLVDRHATIDWSVKGMVYVLSTLGMCKHICF